MQQGSSFFEGKSAVQQALHPITTRLNDLHIPYAVVGGLALFFHGFRRFTEGIDLLVTKDSLDTIHEHLEGLGFIPPFPGSKNLRDVEYGVKIEFLVTGDYPGDGKPKPVAFPDPSQVSNEQDGVCYANLPTLIELKLASGMTNPGRLKDLADVQELIKILQLPETFAEQIHPFVQATFHQLWQAGNSYS